MSCNKEKRIREYYPDGKIEKEYIVVNKKIEGKYTVYYPSGKILYQVMCMNNYFI
jgi:antitoxin component YwqK of YwqJK toxin-antitoxin module